MMKRLAQHETKKKDENRKWLTVPAVDLEERNVLFFILDKPKSQT